MPIITISLSSRQQETIQHLREMKIETSAEIIRWCKEKLTLPAKSKLRQKNGIPGRKNSKKYYQEIIDFYTKNNG